jgi:ketosteroid isomerase-like protein
MTAIDNRSLIERIMEARSRRDHALFIEAMADDFVWRISGSSAWSGEYVGKADVCERC